MLELATVIPRRVRVDDLKAVQRKNRKQSFMNMDVLDSPVRLGTVLWGARLPDGQKAPLRRAPTKFLGKVQQWRLMRRTSGTGTGPRTPGYRIRWCRCAPEERHRHKT